MRHFGFCKNFTGKRHKLPSKITDQLYKDGIVKKHVKPSKQDFFGKKVEKIETGDYNSDTTRIFSSFINKYMMETGDVHVSRIELNKPKTKKISLTSILFTLLIRVQIVTHLMLFLTSRTRK